MRWIVLHLALAVAGLLVLPAAASAASCGQVNRILDTPAPIPDIAQGSATNRIWLPSSGSASEAIEDVDINVDITHPVDDNLDISISHNGKTVNLSSDNGGGGQNYSGTIFDDEGAGGTIIGKSAPFTGSFIPEQALSAFDGEQAGGIWTITVRDDEGTLFGGGGPPPQHVNSWGIRWASNICAPAARQLPCDQQVSRVGVPVGNFGSTSGSSAISGTGSVTRVEAGATITHANVGDLHLTLEHRSKTVNLFTRRGGAGSDLRGTVFTDSAATAIGSGSAPFAGSYRPEDPLSALNGDPPSDPWKIEVADEAAGPSGTVDMTTLRVVLSTCADPDDDAVWSAVDNCPNNANVDQSNHDRFKDALGDPCDPDDDQDGVADTADACPLGVAGTGPAPPDLDGDGCSDAEDLDDDGDGVADTADACPIEAVGSDSDPDGDGCANAIDPDDDGDGVADTADACPLGVIGPGDDPDGNGCKGNEDPDGDGIAESLDRCTLGTPGPGGDADSDGCKDATEDPDDDGDGHADANDNCAVLANAKQDDLDRDGQGDPCDVDDDGDGLVDAVDVCQRLGARSLSGCPAFTRTASFKFTSRTKLSGTLKVAGRTAAPSCIGRQSVVLFRVKRGKDPAVGKPLVTSATGKFALKRRLARGKYYATVKAATLRDVAECGAVKSKTVTRR